MKPSLSLALLLLTVSASAHAGKPPVKPDVTVDTKTALARKQYDANVAFATGYRSRCAASAPGKHVIVMGFGRFDTVTDNTAGRLVEIVTGVKYPLTKRPPDGQIDPPEPQTSVATRTIEVPGVGTASVCGMILPTFWDVAPILLSREIEAFKPSVVIMNGVDGGERGVPMRIELGSANLAQPAVEDGSGILRAHSPTLALVPVIAGGPATIPSQMSWNAVRGAVTKAWSASGGDLTHQISAIHLGGYPSAYLTYLCNDVVYVTNYLMSNPGKRVQLLTPSIPLSKDDRGVATSLQGDFRKTARAFIHWPDVSSSLRPGAASMLRAIVDAQLLASVKGDAPTPGDNRSADEF
ncbi:MAG: hypothetical protein U0174_12735 [Polyangiaceae bacterium]